MMAKNDVRLNAKSVPIFLTDHFDLATKLNSGVLTATMLFISGKSVKIAPFINATMITVRLF